MKKYNLEEYKHVVKNIQILKYNFLYKNETVFYFHFDYGDLYVRLFIEKDGKAFELKTDVVLCVLKQSKSGWKGNVFVKKMKMKL